MNRYLTCDDVVGRELRAERFMSEHGAAIGLRQDWASMTVRQRQDWTDLTDRQRQDRIIGYVAALVTVILVTLIFFGC